MFDFLRRALARNTSGMQIDAARTKLAVANAATAPGLEKQIDEDAARILEALRKEPPKPLIVYLAQLVAGDGSRRVVAAEIDWFGMGRPTVEKMMGHMQKALVGGEHLEAQEVRIFDNGAPITVRPVAKGTA